MNYKIFNLFFKEELTQVQEDYLIGQIQGVLQATKEKLLKIRKRLNNRAFMFSAKISGAGTDIETAKQRIENMALSIDFYFNLEKIDNKTYKFSYCEDIFKVQGINALDSGKFKDLFNQQVFPKMGIQKDQVQLIVAEEERTEPPPESTLSPPG